MRDFPHRSQPSGSGCPWILAATIPACRCTHPYLLTRSVHVYFTLGRNSRCSAVAQLMPERHDSDVQLHVPIFLLYPNGIHFALRLPRGCLHFTLLRLWFSLIFVLGTDIVFTCCSDGSIWSQVLGCGTCTNTSIQMDISIPTDSFSLRLLDPNTQ